MGRTQWRVPPGGHCWCRRAGSRPCCWWCCSASSCSGLLAYRTYQAKPPLPDRVVDPQRRVLYTGEDIERGTGGLPQQRPDGVRLGLRARRLPRARLHRRLPAARRPTSSGGATAARGSDRAARRTIEDFRTNRYDERTGTLKLTAPQAEAHRRLVAPLLALLLRAHVQARPAPERDHRPRRARRADGLLRLDRLGRRRGAARPQLLLHEQLAARAARRQQADGERDRVERCFR